MCDVHKGNQISASVDKYPSPFFLYILFSNCTQRSAFIACTHLCLKHTNTNTPLQYKSLFVGAGWVSLACVGEWAETDKQPRQKYRKQSKPTIKTDNNQPTSQKQTQDKPNIKQTPITHRPQQVRLGWGGRKRFYFGPFSLVQWFCRGLILF